MGLTKERKNPSWIAGKIEIFSIFACLVPTLVQSIIRSFQFSVGQFVDYDDRLTFTKHLSKTTEVSL